MAHHAFVLAGTQDEVAGKARSYAARQLALAGNHPDISIYAFGLFSVDDARRVTDAAYQSSTSGAKVIIVHAARLFHEAQNALLKVIEEPPRGVTIILGVPSLGILLPTLRSRVLPLPEGEAAEEEGRDAATHAFLALSPTEREKYVAKLLDRAKADKDEVKQAARAEAQELLAGLTRAAHALYAKAGAQAAPARVQELVAFLEDLAAFAPLMHERSVPLKLIFEHLLLSIPSSLGNRPV